MKEMRVVSDLFKDIIPSILVTGKDVLDNESDYIPFVVNRAISHHYDCIIAANTMNALPNLDKKMQYDFLINTIRKHKRPFQKWQKREKIEDLEAVKEFFCYSNSKAKEALALLSTSQIEEIRSRILQVEVSLNVRRPN